MNGLKLSRYAVQDIIDTKSEAKVHFWIRPPTPGLYKFAVYAREVQAGEANRMYCAVAEYMVSQSLLLNCSPILVLVLNTSLTIYLSCISWMLMTQFHTWNHSQNALATRGV